MPKLETHASSTDFGTVRAAMQRYVDDEILPGVSYAIFEGNRLTEVACVGYADRERRQPLREDHLFRVFSNTKLVTSCAVLLLIESGRLGLDDPIENFMPQLGSRQALRAGATALDQTEPALRSITIRHLLSHSSGLSYGLLDPGSLLFQAYLDRQVLSPAGTLADMVDALADTPLSFQPGTYWEYSVATDVLARLVEIISGQSFDTFIDQHIFKPLGMVDSGFGLRANQAARLSACYAGADLLDPMQPGLTRIDSGHYPDPKLPPFPRHSGGGGLLSSLPDMVALVRALLPDGGGLLRPETLAMMKTNQLPSGVSIRFPRIGEVPGKGYGLAGAVTLTPSPFDPPDSLDEFQWGGIAGSHWWISPRRNLAAVLMTQRLWSFWHPFSFEFKRLVYQASA